MQSPWRKPAANDAETIGLFSSYWNANALVFVGAVNQIKPMAFGNKKENPFHHITKVATIARMEATGGNFDRLEASSRYYNRPLFDLCARVNVMPQMQPVADAFDETLIRQYALMNKII